MGPGYVPTFLYYFVVTTFIVVFIVQQGGEELQIANPFQIGMFFGLTAGFLGARFNSSQTISLPVKNKGAFQKQLLQALNSWGYQETSELNGFTVYQRAGLSQFFSGKIFVQLDKNTATIAGRASKMRSLQQQLAPNQKSGT
ncbi:hypothetical protein [Pantanalinema sp. GBBB05]|uniref:hypothetical protein n=1 Tax=Pantanalinema sp. GBBB05 TaxID=2604139 RepID=UPI001D2E0D7C|nr:hypothetical protein [Pantanalinema sp. GBBB05]